jgi:VPDSG-CTERM motif
VMVTVQDNQGNPAQIFTLTGLGTNSDFARQGIISLDGETIQSVTLTSDFKEVKQIEFSLAGVRVPDSGATAMLLGGALAGLALGRRYLKR